MKTQELDADTLRKRALYDRKGNLFVGGIDLYYSCHRSDQFDLYVQGKLIATCGSRRICEELEDFHAKMLDEAAQP